MKKNAWNSNSAHRILLPSRYTLHHPNVQSYSHSESHAVTYLNIVHDQRCLTSLIGGEPMFEPDRIVSRKILEINLDKTDRINCMNMVMVA